MATFKKAATIARDTVGAKKLLDKRIVTETANLWEDQDWAKVNANSEELATILNQLMRLSNSNVRQYNDVNSDYVNTLSTIKEYVQKNFDAFTSMEPVACPVRNITSLREYEDKIQETGFKKESLLEIKDRITADMATLSSELEDIRKVESLDVTQLQKQRVELRDTIDKLTTRGYFFDWPSIDGALLTQVSDIETQLINTIVGKSGEDYSQVFTLEESEQLKSDKTHKGTELNRLNTLQSKSIHRKRLITEAKREECPECRFKFIPGVSDKELTELDKNIATLSPIIDGIHTDLECIAGKLSQYHTVENNRRAIKAIMMTYPSFRPLWMFIAENKLLEGNPNDLLLYLYKAKDDIENCQSLHNAESALYDVDRQLAKAGDSDIAAERVHLLNKRESELFERIKINSVTLHEVENERKFLVKGFNRGEFIHAAETEMSTLLKSYYALCHERVASLRERKLEEDIKLHQLKLARITDHISEQHISRELVSDLRRQLNVMDEDIIDWKCVADALSPTSGIIAEQLTGWLNAFTADLNSIISRVWSYELKILPTKGNVNNLDYKFPVVVDGDPNHTPDVALTSTGQQDIIDFAFRLVAMSYLNMDDHPIYADELGSSFDIGHREQLQIFLKTLLDGRNCSQLWLISHALAVQNSLGACEVCVIDKSNIAVPDVYNEHVEFK